MQTYQNQLSNLKLNLKEKIKDERHKWNFCNSIILKYQRVENEFMFQRKTYLILLILSLPILIIISEQRFSDVVGSTNDNSETSLIQATASDFTVQDVGSGKTYSLSDFRGTVVVLDLFATWCPPCQLSIPFLRELYSQYTQSELRIISVDVDSSESQSTVSQFRQEENMDWIVSLDSGGSINSVYGSGSIPTFYIIDQEGSIIWSDSGFSNEETKPKMQTTIETLLADGSDSINPGSTETPRGLIIFAEVTGGLAIAVAVIFGYYKIKNRIKTKMCPTCSNVASSKCSKCGIFTCANCSTKGCKNCGSRQFIRL